VAACFAAVFLIPGIVNVVQKGDPTILIAVAGIFALVFLNISRIRFECTDNRISYTSLLKRTIVAIDDLNGVRIGFPGVDSKAPKFILQTRSRGEIVIEVRALPLPDVQRFAAYLCSIGIPFEVDADSRSGSIAKQVLATSKVGSSLASVS